MGQLQEFVSDPLRKKALLCNLALGLLMVVVGSKQFSAAHTALYTLATAAQEVWLVWLIFRLRGEEKHYRTQPNRVTSIGLWGYIWRSAVIFYLSMAVLVLGVLLLGFRPQSPPPLLWVVSMNLTLIGVMPLVCWLLFSRDRKGQLLWLASAVR